MPLLSNCGWLALVAVLLAGTPTLAQSPLGDGPYNLHFLAGGRGQSKTLGSAPGAVWTIAGWVRADEIADDHQNLVEIGTADDNFSLALDDGHPQLSQGGTKLTAAARVAPGQWVWLAASGDGVRDRLWIDGRELASGPAGAGPAGVLLRLGDRPPGREGFAGRLAEVTVAPTALAADQALALAAARPDFDLIAFEEASPAWPVQVKQMVGQATPQDAWTLPHGKGAVRLPQAAALRVTPGLQALSDRRWRLGGFHLRPAPDVTAPAAVLSQPGFAEGDWLVATVPGTVLTSMVDRGLYPDPDFGLNNLAIPERLGHQSYWYRSEFVAPNSLSGRHLQLVLAGVNYAAEIWLNGRRLGDVRGAFRRARFDVTAALHPGGSNALAVLVSPPPHPGIAHEQSISAGVGENGGMQALDGPTFIASEGWDWIPGVRDRNTGLWQEVALEASGVVRLGNVQVITTLPRPDRSEADISLSVTLQNLSARPVTARLSAGFDAVVLQKTLSLPPGEGKISLTPAEFAQLRVANPKLWWPNGLGEPALHALTLTVAVGDAISDQSVTRFGMREISYELSLLDPAGHLRRVEIAPAKAPGTPLVDGRHQAIRQTSSGWVQSLTPAASASPAVQPLADDRLTPYLVLRVNGVRVPARGGSWGTDDWRKRVSRERLEPYFRLHRNAHLNIIRNWVGQNTEDVFYDLADEYGLLVLNDFWVSTQDYNIEPEDVPLFLANAADVIGRYSRHPCIALWFGRNEGVPQPILNEGLADLVNRLDGSRLYFGSSNRINLQDSGPYDYRPPASYFTTHAKGFAVELGTPSFPTLEAFEIAVAAEDRWPINDVWAYHDWHQTGNGATAPFMAALARKFGEAGSLEDFERKAQMLNYESHRAIFEGMNAELWTKTSGRLLWMTQPAWPSTNWQILSADYDTHAAYYGVQKAAEPIHLQLDLPDFALTVVNNTLEPLDDLTVQASVTDLAGHRLLSSLTRASLAADCVTQAGRLALAPLLAAHGVVLVDLTLTDDRGRLLSENFYWQGQDDDALRALSALPPQPVSLAAALRQDGADSVIGVSLTNQGDQAALMNKLTLLDASGHRLLPAFASDNYISLLPGQSRQVEIKVPAARAAGPVTVALRGWNAQPARIVLPP